MSEAGSSMPDPDPDPLRAKRRALVVLVSVATLFGGLGFVAASMVKSPADVLADSAPPPPSILTASVERREVSDAWVTRGVVTVKSTVSAVPTRKPAGVVEALVTKRGPAPDTQLKVGQVILEVSGSPVFILPGKLRPYRHLVQGDVGPDVQQLNAALAQAGFLADTAVNSVYSANTSSAVRAMFGASNYGSGDGTRLTMNSVVFVDSTAPYVVDSKTRIGQNIQDAHIQVATSDLVIEVEATDTSRQSFKRGAEATIYSEVLDESRRASVSAVAGQGRGTSATVTLTPDKRIEPRWAGQDVRVTIHASSSQGEVLAVPVSAVFYDGAGLQHVVVVSQSGRQTKVRVDVGQVAGGYVEVASSRAELKPGDQVLVGQQ